MQKKVGRPTDYSLSIAKKICDVVSTRTEGLKTLSRDYDFFPDPSTIHKWRNEKQEFSEMYARAKLQQADILAEECLQIADDCDGSNFAKARLQIDTRK